ncbi:MAG: sugar phosphate isomerase/epimerase [Oscillospiraceae bacterium]|nr:sugar phosphate isomerase/epimerase [Oscillospiraceae bacterium]
MKTGVVLHYSERLPEDFRWCVENRIPTCQLSVPPEQETAETAERIVAACRESGMEITALVGTWSGPNEWNFRQGPQTLGIVPAAYRYARMQELVRCAELARMLEVPGVCTHMGFIPENPNDPAYGEFVGAARWLAGAFRARGIGLYFETGQETPVTLLRVLGDIGAENTGLNFDPANLLMYGKANPIDALDVVGRYVRGVHAKDGEYPTDGYSLGREMPMGQGRVGFPAFVAKLKEIGYDGALTIEREISGPQQKNDVLTANGMLLDLIG